MAYKDRTKNELEGTVAPCLTLLLAVPILLLSRLLCWGCLCVCGSDPSGLCVRHLFPLNSARAAQHSTRPVMSCQLVLSFPHSHSHCLCCSALFAALFCSVLLCSLLFLPPLLHLYHLPNFFLCTPLLNLFRYTQILSSLSIPPFLIDHRPHRALQCFLLSDTWCEGGCWKSD